MYTWLVVCSAVSYCSVVVSLPRLQIQYITPSISRGVKKEGKIYKTLPGGFTDILVKTLAVPPCGASWKPGQTVRDLGAG